MEPIAIIGIGCRFPGAKTPEDFWQILRNGIDKLKRTQFAKQIPLQYAVCA